MGHKLNFKADFDFPVCNINFWVYKNALMMFSGNLRE